MMKLLQLGHQKSATNFKDVVRGENPVLVGNAWSCSANPGKYDDIKLLYAFNVQCTDGNRTVLVKGNLPDEVLDPNREFDDVLQYDLTDIDVQLNCTCPHWVYGGAEYFARQRNYLYGNPRGPATKPTRDWNQRNYVCKHVYAVYTYLSRQPIVIEV
ncbi:MAG: SWIM zinc finger family protein [Candidatus Paceibacterota bacterium]